MPSPRTTLSLVILSMVVVSLLPMQAVWAERVQQRDEISVLPIKGELVVNVFLYDVSLSWFEARDLRHLLQLLRDTNAIRPFARSQFYSRGTEFVPFEFEVKLNLIVPSARIQQEFRELLKSRVSRTPYQIAQQAVEFAVGYGMPLAWTDQTIRARDALYVFSYLTEKYFPEVAGKYAIFLFCGIPAMGGDRPAIYYTYGQSPDTGAYLADFGLSMYGGSWWGRYFYVDLCSYPPRSFYQQLKPIFELGTAAERVYHVAELIDIIIDMEFVKSLIYKPRYNIQTLFDVIVVDATVAGVGYDMIVRYFDSELLSKAFRTLMPYNFFTTRLREVELRDVPELSQAIQHTPEGILLLPEKAYDILKRRGMIDESIREFMDYVPAIILYTTTTSWVKEPSVLGVAVGRQDDPSLPLAATGAIYHEVLIKQGLTPLVMHEIGHTLGLRHPHDDFDEYRNSGVGFFALTYFTETVMSYSQSWIVSLNREKIFEDLYPIRTFWSIFDLDNIDRAVVCLLLQEYEQNHREIIQSLKSAGLDLTDVPEIKEALDLARQYSLTAVDEFRNHNYFDRKSFKGLGAQLVSAFDYAFVAALQTGNIKDYYLPGVLYEVGRLGAQASALRQNLSNLRAETESARRALEESQRLLSQKRQELQSLMSAGESLNAELQRVEQAVAEVRRVRDEVSRKEAELQRVVNSVKQSEEELSSLRSQNNTLLAVLAVEVVVVAALVVWFRRNNRRGLPPPPPPPPLPTASS
ncbi:MAG: hypothetical protein QXO30_00345 [Candidatus Caldarchaeum sp.]